MWLQLSDGGGEERAHLGHEVMYTVNCEVESSEAASEETPPPPVVILGYDVLLFVKFNEKKLTSAHRWK